MLKFLCLNSGVLFLNLFHCYTLYELDNNYCISSLSFELFVLSFMQEDVYIYATLC